MPIDPVTAQAMTPAAFTEKYGRPIEQPPEDPNAPPAPLVIVVYRLVMPNGQAHDLTQYQAERLRDELSAAVEP